MADHRAGAEGPDPGSGIERAPGPGRTRWAQAAVSAVVVVYVAVQLLLGVRGLLIEHPQQGGWEMYSRLSQRPDYRVELTGGAVRPVDIDRFRATGRSDLDLSQLMPRHLCRQIPGAVRVLVTARGSDRVQKHRC